VAASAGVRPASFMMLTIIVVYACRCLRFRGGLVFKAHRLFVSLNPRLESNREEGDPVPARVGQAGG